ncbi:CRISPR-associated helicase/endonuclease Cas3 [Marinobacter sp. X15-166B]|uniref:CRISPR-associated helicase/endonuclease Cas3 n=1 Tax=Marinobacter sp. X15-166B TaxID=1897620 RepID=UPI00085CD385|nr:CRISPR-associated helicase/endonuclease Cas3 [Marinobacter sp. X15-166B]OEY65570.1 CRISPR-associated helicase/endonuclease Cas3 [Marinobacter sp. X15-166B]
MAIDCPYFSYWGKAQADVNSQIKYHLLPYHSLDVAAVGRRLLCPSKTLTTDLATFLELSPQQLNALFGFALALHDLGKFASAFQGLYRPENTSLIDANSRFGYDGSQYRHDRMGLYFWHEIEPGFFDQITLEETPSRTEDRQLRKAVMVLMNCVFGHHGQPIDTKDVTSVKHFTEPHNVEAARAFVNDAYRLFQPEFPLDKFGCKNWRSRLEQVSWQLAGMAVLADWVGSNREYFPYKNVIEPLSNYWAVAQRQAQKALKAAALDQAPKVAPFQSVEYHFGFEPTPLQAWAEQVDLNDSPQLFILEDVTGAGKTEAALTLTHRLMEAGAADGFYFGLPTMATSNAMFSRVADHYQQMLTSDGDYQPSIVLAHGAREMNDRFQEAKLNAGPQDRHYDKTDQTATAQCNQWLADSRKKALLAPVGVGTLDQTLLAVLPRRHQSLRLLGLNRKVLIFDEVHSADEYMFELLDGLLKLHLHQGGSVILLTATLSQNQRQRLANIWLSAVGIPVLALEETAFPLATHITIDPELPIKEQPLKSRPEVSREVAVSVVHSESECLDVILASVAQGQCVVWIRNTVNDALAAHALVQEAIENPDDCLLFHSRFVLHDRKVIENKVLDIFGKQGGSQQRQGRVLIATQVFQESLDADTDVMISDICPIDDLIQRAGRLHRHTRNNQGHYQQGISDQRAAPVLYVHAPEWEDSPTADWLSLQFQNTEYVYRSPGRLWLGLRTLLTNGAIRMPEDARTLIESVYSVEAYEQIPASLVAKEHELIGAQRAKAAKASSQLLNLAKGYSDKSSRYWTEDNHDISTRYRDIETVSVLLLKEDEGGELTPWVTDPYFAVALSTVKVAKRKYADKLASLSEQQTEAVHQAYPQAKYLRLWLPEQDSQFTYNETTGFCEQQTQEVS